MNTPMVVRNTNTMAEYNLQQQVKAAGGRFVMQQDEEDHQQFRWRDEPDVQRTVVSDDEHVEYDMFLSMWDSQKDKKQRQCKKCNRRVRRGGAGPKSLCGWDCEDKEDFFVCMDCVPVAIRVPLW